MSCILDALNKSEEEKKQHRTPGLNTIHQSSEGRKTRRGPLLLIGIGLLMINLIAVLIWWIFFSVAPEARDTGSISMQPITSKPPPRADSQRQSNTSTNNPKPINAETALRRDGQSRLTSPSESDQNSVSTNAIPQIISREIAAIRFSSHIFADDASLRRVVLNGQPLKEGNRFGSGLTLQQITEDGVILRYQGQTVAINVLSRWAAD